MVCTSVFESIKGGYLYAITALVGPASRMNSKCLNPTSRHRHHGQETSVPPRRRKNHRSQGCNPSASPSYGAVIVPSTSVVNRSSSTAVNSTFEAQKVVAVCNNPAGIEVLIRHWVALD